MRSPFKWYSFGKVNFNYLTFLPKGKARPFHALYFKQHNIELYLLYSEHMKKQDFILSKDKITLNVGSLGFPTGRFYFINTENMYKNCQNEEGKLMDWRL
jgi:hypothetical protein